MSEMEINFSDLPDRPTQGAGMVAIYDGFCKECRIRILAGEDRIMFSSDHNTYIHIECFNGLKPYSDPKPADFCPICWQARAANGTCGCLA